ncbi:hypothetical protein ACV36C_38130, partial [Pseudomonas aeruginosa]
MKHKLDQALAAEGKPANSSFRGRENATEASRRDRTSSARPTASAQPPQPAFAGIILGHHGPAPYE